MFADKIKNIGNYPQLAKYQAPVMDLINKALAGELADGRYDLMGDELYGLVQHNITRSQENSKMEAHEIYADLQCILSGHECICVNYTEDLTITDDRRPESDLFFFADAPIKGYSILDAGCFGYYAPTDAHMPNVMVGQPGEVFKIVFKIKVK